MATPSADQFLKGVGEFEKKEKRDAMYRVATCCRIIRDIAGELRSVSTRSDKTVVRLIDEYNYSKYTKKRI
jgi:hypothetical protein